MKWKPPYGNAQRLNPIMEGFYSPSLVWSKQVILLELSDTPTADGKYYMQAFLRKASRTLNS